MIKLHKLWLTVEKWLKYIFLHSKVIKNDTIIHDVTNGSTEKMKHSNITKVLIDHLERETDYAILFSGSWGSGKSYYIKNTFIPTAKATKTISSGGTKNFSPILVSLFGIKSINDIKDRLFLSLYPLLDKKHFKIGSAFSKAILKSIDIPNYLTVGLINNVGANLIEAGNEAVSTIKDSLDLSDLVIILDDLERADPSLLSLNEILGYINSLVEENNIKVIIIANDRIIKSKDYKRIKEKTIGHTIHFEKNFDSVFSDLINGQGGNFDEEFRKHISDKKSLLLELLEKEWQNRNDINLRTLKYFLSFYSVIFNSVKNKFDATELEERRIVIEDNLIRLSLGISIEYKKGKITFRNRQGIDDYVSLIFDSVPTPDIEKTYFDEFYEKYFTEKNAVFYESILSFITGGDTFVYQNLLGDLKSSFYITETDGIAKEYQALQLLQVMDIYDLEDDESLKIHNDIFAFLKSGKYKTSELPSLFYQLTADTCPLSIEPEKLCSLIIDLLENKKNEHEYHPLLAEYLTVNSENPYSEYLIAIRKKLLEINEYKGKDEHEKEIMSLNKLAKKNFNDFGQELMKDESKLRMLLCNLEPKFVFDTFLSAKNKDKRLFNLAINHRYINKAPYGYKSDQDFISNLGELADKYIDDNQNNNMSTVLVRQLSKYIKEAIVALKSID